MRWVAPFLRPFRCGGWPRSSAAPFDAVGGPVPPPFLRPFLRWIENLLRMVDSLKPGEPVPDLSILSSNLLRLSYYPLVPGHPRFTDSLRAESLALRRYALKVSRDRPPGGTERGHPSGLRAAARRRRGMSVAANFCRGRAGWPVGRIPDRAPDDANRCMAVELPLEADMNEKAITRAQPSQTSPPPAHGTSNESAEAMPCPAAPGQGVESSRGVARMIGEGQLAFQKALPELLGRRFRQWVAYHGSEQIGFAASKADLHAECVRRGIPRGHFIIRRITPDSLDTSEIETSLDV
jgi:hypothetical protein